MSDQSKKVTPKNVTNYNKAIALGKKLSKTPDITKAEITRQMYPLLKDEPREVIVQAFIEGAGLTSKGAMTYFYNVRRGLKNK